MKLYGYNAEQEEQSEPNVLSELILESNSSELNDIAEFLFKTAKRMEEMGSAYDHEHLADKKPKFEGMPHLIVVKEK